jgi:glycosyltransferase involved in cell wall biosynthesis
VVTCHNLGTYLPETLESLAAQTERNFDVVVVNDGSDDAATCRLLSGLDGPNMRVIHSERRGLPGARNLGVSHTAGEFLCMVDADDLLDPDYLERSVHTLTSRPDVAFASHWLRAFGDETWDWTPTDCTFPALLQTNTVNGAALMRREMFDRLGGFDETMVDGCEDWEFWIRAVAAGFSGVIIPEFLFRYRRRADSMSRQMEHAPGYGALVRQVVDRHADTFLAHLPAVLARNDEEIAARSVGYWTLNADWAVHMKGQLAWLADNQRTAEATRQAEERAAAARTEVELRETRDEARRLHADYMRELEDNQALRGSLSWRLTAPLRALLDMVRR